MGDGQSMSTMKKIADSRNGIVALGAVRAYALYYYVQATAAGDEPPIRVRRRFHWASRSTEW